MNEDWEADPNNPFFTTEYPTEKCSQDHFGEGTEAEEYFKSWNGFHLFCPTIPKNDSTFKALELKGRQGSSKNNNILFEINICTEGCPDDLDEFLSDMSVDYWALQNILDLTKYND